MYPLIVFGLVMTALAVILSVIAFGEVIAAFRETEQETFDRKFDEIVDGLDG